MKKPTQSEIMKKWASALGSMGVTGSQLDNISKLAENQSNHILEENALATEITSGDFPSLLPLAMKVASKTISNELIFATQEEIDRVKVRVQSENRDSKIRAVVEDGEYVEKKVEDDSEYQKLMKKGVTPMSAPSGVLHYLDFKYDESVTKSSSHKKTRRSKKKKSNGGV
jgi:hypothetical protein